MDIISGGIINICSETLFLFWLRQGEGEFQSVMQCPCNCDTLENFHHWTATLHQTITNKTKRNLLAGIYFNVNSSQKAEDITLINWVRIEITNVLEAPSKISLILKMITIYRPEKLDNNFSNHDTCSFVYWYIQLIRAVDAQNLSSRCFGKLSPELVMPDLNLVFMMNKYMRNLWMFLYYR